MNTNEHCQEILLHFPDAEAGSLEPGLQRLFETHLQDCAECARAWEGFVTAVREAETVLAGPRPAPEGAPPDYWETFLPRLRARIGRDRGVDHPAAAKRTTPVWALPAAAALVLGFCLGALLGTGWGGTREPGVSGSSLLALPPAESASAGNDSNSLPADDYAPVTLPQNDWDYDWDTVDSLGDEQLDLLVAELLGEIS